MDSASRAGGSDSATLPWSRSARDQLDQGDRDVGVARPEDLPPHLDGFAEHRLRPRGVPHLPMEHAEVVETLRQRHVRRPQRAPAERNRPF